MTGRVTVDEFVNCLRLFGFDSGKSDYVSEACGDCNFEKWDDVARVLRAFSFDSGRIKCLEAMRDKGILDRIGEGNHTGVIGCFAFDGGKTKALRILGKRGGEPSPPKGTRVIVNGILGKRRDVAPVSDDEKRGSSGGKAADVKRPRRMFMSNVVQGEGSKFVCVGADSVTDVTQEGWSGCMNIDGYNIKWEGPGIRFGSNHVLHYEDTTVFCVNGVHTVKYGAGHCSIEELSKPPKSDE